MKVEYNLDNSHFKVTCDKCFKDFTDKQIDTKEKLCYCPHCNKFVIGMGYLVTRQRKDSMKYARPKVKKSSGYSPKQIKTKLMKRKVRVG